MCSQRSPTAFAACTVAAVACAGPISLANVWPVHDQVPRKKSSCACSDGMPVAASAGADGLAASAANTPGLMQSAAIAANRCLDIVDSPSCVIGGAPQRDPRRDYCAVA